MPNIFRRRAAGAAVLAAAALSLSSPAWCEAPPPAIRAEIKKRHAESVERLQQWVKQPSIAAENRGMNEGCEMMIRLLREAGFQSAVRVPTDGQPAVFATLDAGAARTVGLYF